MLCTSEGTRAWMPTGFTVIRVVAAARASDGARILDARSWVAKNPDALPPLAEMQAEVRDMARWLEALRDAPVEDDYLGPVLFEDTAAIELFRQLAAPEIAGTPAPEQGRDATARHRPPRASAGGCSRRAGRSSTIPPDIPTRPAATPTTSRACAGNAWSLSQTAWCARC
jgi:hypothetical protein